MEGPTDFTLDLQTPCLLKPYSQHLVHWPECLGNPWGLVWRCRMTPGSVTPHTFSLLSRASLCSLRMLQYGPRTISWEASLSGPRSSTGGPRTRQRGLASPFRPSLDSAYTSGRVYRVFRDHSRLVLMPLGIPRKVWHTRSRKYQLISVALYSSKVIPWGHLWSTQQLFKQRSLFYNWENWRSKKSGLPKICREVKIPMETSDLKHCLSVLAS